MGINLKDKYGYTPLPHAARRRHEAIVRLLMQHGGVDTR